MHHDDDHDDDIQIGRMWTRKEVMRLLGATGALALVVGCGSSTDTAVVDSTGTTATTASPLTTVSPVAAASATPTPTPTPGTTPTPGGPFPGGSPMPPIVTPSATPLPSPIPNVVFTPALTEGPYFVDERIQRSDTRGDSTRVGVVNGRVLNLALRVQQVVGAVVSPYVGAQVDIWQTDAEGVYSDIASEGTTGQNFLRGYQITDSNGLVNFTTVFPGWYRGRTIHIHVKIRKDNYTINTQLFFDDAFSDTIVNTAPYNSRGTRDTRNTNDGIYQENSGGVAAGSKLTLSPTDSGGVLAAAYTFGLAF